VTAGVAEVILTTAPTAAAGERWRLRTRPSEGVIPMRRFPWRWVLAGILLLGVAAIFYIDRWAPEELTRRGRALVNSKEYPQAIDSFNRAIEIDSKYAPAYHGRGLAYLNQGDRDRAIVDFGQAIRLAPDDHRARYHRGVAYSRAGDYDRALADFGEAIRLKPDYAAAYMTRSWVDAKKGDDAQARADRQKAIELDPALEKAAGGSP
jgi:tetratricopeptide (TPR) repeat protein